MAGFVAVVEDAETRTWLTTTTGTNRLGGSTGEHFGIKDLGHGRVLVPGRAISRLQDLREEEDGGVTGPHPDGTYTLWIDGLDYALTPYADPTAEDAS